jgi:hypothetical protein
VYRFKSGFLLLTISLVGLGCNLLSTPSQTTDSPTATPALTITHASVTPPALAASAPTSSPYLGLVYPPLPAGMDEKESALTTTGDVAFLVMRVIDNSRQMFWFLEQTGQDAGGHLTWTVIDVMEQPAIQDREWLVIGTSCQINNQYDEEIVAIGIEDALWQMNPPRLAWRANHITGRMESIPTEGVVCDVQNPGP